MADNILQMTIGQNVTKYRIRAGMTQAQLAESLFKNF